MTAKFTRMRRERGRRPMRPAAADRFATARMRKREAKAMGMEVHTEDTTRSFTDFSTSAAPPTVTVTPGGNWDAT
jgi:hypothetical protein